MEQKDLETLSVVSAPEKFNSTPSTVAQIALAQEVASPASLPGHIIICCAWHHRSYC